MSLCVKGLKQVWSGVHVYMLLHFMAASVRLWNVAFIFYFQ